LSIVALKYLWGGGVAGVGGDCSMSEHVVTRWYRAPEVCVCVRVCVRARVCAMQCTDVMCVRVYARARACVRARKKPFVSFFAHERLFLSCMHTHTHKHTHKHTHRESLFRGCSCADIRDIYTHFTHERLPLMLPPTLPPARSLISAFSSFRTRIRSLLYNRCS
jgi:hypothetical protein